jgi:BON domain
MNDPWDDLYYGTGAFLITPSGVRIPVGEAATAPTSTGGADAPPAGAARGRAATSVRADAGDKYLGVGPKGYRRTDERIHDAVCDRMLLDPYLDASDIVVGVSKGRVTLTGSVPTVRMRESAFAAADRIAPGAVKSELKVVAPADLAPPASAPKRTSRARGRRKRASR